MAPIPDQIWVWKLITETVEIVVWQKVLDSIRWVRLGPGCFLSNWSNAYIYMFVCVCCITGRCGPCDGKTVREWFQPDHDLSLRGSQPQLQKHVQAQTSTGEMAEWCRYNGCLFFITVSLVILHKGARKQLKEKLSFNLN